MVLAVGELRESIGKMAMYSLFYGKPVNRGMEKITGSIFILTGGVSLN